jgi:hypothetical protein
VRLVLVLALKSFDLYVAGQERYVLMDQAVAELIVKNYLRLLWDSAWEVSDGGTGDDLHSPGVPSGG